MRALVEHEPMSLSVDVWLLDEAGRLWRPDPGDGGGPRVETVEPETNLRTVAPSIRLPREAFDALLREGMAVAPPDVAQRRHLDDVIGVRDRLLTLVEERTQ